VNFGGKPLMSRGTIASARALLILSISVILTAKLEVDTSSVEFLGISVKSNQLNEGLLYVLLFLFASHVINWIGDIISLRKFNESLYDKDKGKLSDDGADRITHLDWTLDNLNKEDPNYENVYNELRALSDSQKWYKSYAGFYVFVWHFLVPFIALTWAGCILWQ